MANIDYDDGPNYDNLSGANQTLVDTAVTAIRAAFAGVTGTRQKGNVREILNEIIQLEEET